MSQHPPCIACLAVNDPPAPGEFLLISPDGTQTQRLCSEHYHRERTKDMPPSDFRDLEERIHRNLPTMWNEPSYFNRLYKEQMQEIACNHQISVHDLILNRKRGPAILLPAPKKETSEAAAVEEPKPEPEPEPEPVTKLIGGRPWVKITDEPAAKMGKKPKNKGAA